LNSIPKLQFKSADELLNYLYSFFEEVEERPIPVYLNNSNYGAITRESLVTNVIFRALYKPAPSWYELAENFAQLLNGDATPAFIAYSQPWLLNPTGDESGTFVLMNVIGKRGMRLLSMT
jgi:hypothetical protein